jgi:hypothetical protein
MACLVSEHQGKRFFDPDVGKFIDPSDHSGDWTTRLGGLEHRVIALTTRGAGWTACNLEFACIDGVVVECDGDGCATPPVLRSR